MHSLAVALDLQKQLLRVKELEKAAEHASSEVPRRVPQWC